MIFPQPLVEHTPHPKGARTSFFKINIVLKWSMNKRFPMNTIINPVVKAVPPTFTDTDHSCRALLWI